MTKIDTALLTLQLKNFSKSIGFQDVGVSKAIRLDDEAVQLEKWLNHNFNGEMDYMNRHFDLRIDPTKLHPNTQSIISFSYNYFNENKLDVDNSFRIAQYAYGQDYHQVVKNKLQQVIQWIKNQIGDIDARAFVDSAPVMERVWAEKSGIGWVGKNSLLMTKAKGSFFFLGEIFLDIVLDYDIKTKNYCGTCTKCIDACPTQAIIAPYEIDSNRCISYLTIEYRKNNIASDLQSNLNQWIYGCDICQNVCPINARAQSHNEPSFEPKESLKLRMAEKFENFTEEEFKELFRDSAIKRTKYSGFMRNIEWINKKENLE